ncbi:hypothetical protein CVT25_008426 [Psilocybe cyanescens]|uniref:Uncharacterized protein n=1 Tax=Psilocybe cyanescens TaxID=93625 RepID=A0A409WUV1_PSICY|nr:hypothetical protein CVT25_008426 [Psilocybe cyanescens]
MYRNSAAIDPSGKWASAEEILANPRNQKISIPTQNDWGVESSVPGNHAENAAAVSGRRGEQHPRLSYQPTASSASALSYLTSQQGLSPRSPTAHTGIPRLEGHIHLVPVRRGNNQLEQTPRHLENGVPMLQNRSDPTSNHTSITFPNPQLASPYAQVPQYDYRPSSILPIESSFSNDTNNMRSSGSAPQMPRPHPYPHPYIAPSTQTPHVAQNVYPHQQQQQSDNHRHHAPSAIQSTRTAAVRPDAFVAIDPFRTQRRDRKDELNEPPSFMEAGAAAEASGSRVFSPASVNQLQEKHPSAERVGRQPSSDGHGYAATGTGTAKVEYINEVQVHDPVHGLVQQQPPPTTTATKHPTLALAPVRRRTIPDTEQHHHHKAHTQEGSLENYGSYSWKQPPLLASSHSHSHSNSYAYAYAPNVNGSAAPGQEPRRSTAFWRPKSVAGYLRWPFSRSKGPYGHVASYTYPPHHASSPSSGDAGAEPRPRQTQKPPTRITPITFVFRTLPTLIYIRLMLLGAPAFYFARVARVFEEGGMTMAQIERMGLEMRAAAEGVGVGVGDSEKEKEKVGLLLLPAGYRRVRAAWEAFVDGAVGEWKMVGVVSVLLLSAILTTLQIENANANATAAGDPVIRYTALLSLMCALMSLAFGCVYVLRFGTMRKIWKAVEWALAIAIVNTYVLIIGHVQEAKKDRTKVVVWWNVWVMLAMPVVWLAWSIILYVTCIMTFVWRTSSRTQNSTNTTTNNAHGISDAGLLAVRIVISAILGLGIVYMGLAMRTLGRYGDEMDTCWRRRCAWVSEQRDEDEDDRCRGLDGHQSWRPGQQPVPSFVPPAPSAPYGYAYGVDDRRNDDYDAANQFARVDATKPLTDTNANANANYVASPTAVQVVQGPSTHHDPSHDKSAIGLGLQQGTGKGQGQGQGSRAAEFSSSELSITAERNMSTLSRDPTTSVPVSSPQESEDPRSASASASASVRKRTSLAVPPPATLPPIPGTPMSGSGSGLSGPRSRSRTKSLQTTASATFTTTSSVYADRDRSSGGLRYYSGFNLESRETTSLGIGVGDADADADARHAGGRRVLSSPTRMASVSTASGSGGSEYLGSDRDAMQEEEESTSAQSRAQLSNDETEASMSVPRTPVPSPATVSPR